jgi:MYXO-CTERM domain-containing protein
MSTRIRWFALVVAPLAFLLVVAPPARGQVDASVDAGAGDVAVRDAVLLPSTTVADDGDCAYGGGQPGTAPGPGLLIGLGLLVALAWRRRS